MRKRKNRVKLSFQLSSFVTHVAVTVEIFEFLVEGLVRKGLIAGKIEILARVSHPINLQSQLFAQLNQQGNAAQERRRATGLQDEHVGVDKE